MDSTYGSVRATLPSLTTIELVDLMQAIDEELMAREVTAEAFEVDNDLIEEYLNAE